MEEHEKKLAGMSLPELAILAQGIIITVIAIVTLPSAL